MSSKQSIVVLTQTQYYFFQKNNTHTTGTHTICTGIGFLKKPVLHCKYVQCLILSLLDKRFRETSYQKSRHLFWNVYSSTMAPNSFGSSLTWVGVSAGAPAIGDEKNLFPNHLILPIFHWRIVNQICSTHWLFQVSNPCQSGEFRIWGNLTFVTKCIISWQSGIFNQEFLSTILGG